MKKRILSAVVLLIILIGAAQISMGSSGCGDNTQSVRNEQKVVDQQQSVYNKNQPAPFFNYSLARDLWTQFYKAQNSAVSTWSYITDDFGVIRFSTPSQGYPIPMDTELTNPSQVSWGSNGAAGTVDQPEPNGLFTSKTTNATIIMAANPDGTLSPIYSELRVTAFPFPVREVKMPDGTIRWERVEGTQPTIKLKVEGQ